MPPSTAAQPESFLFIAAKADGGKAFGVRPADDEGVLARDLGRERLILLRSYRVPAFLAGGRGELPLKDQAEATTQLAALLDRGVPLVESLEVVAEAVSSASRVKISRMRDLVSQGTSFASASVETGAFDEVTAAVFGAAERTGDLAGASRQLARNARRRLKIRETATTLLFYPLIVLTISAFVGVFMLTVVVPMVADSMRQMLPDGQSLPLATELLAAAGEGLRANPLLALGVVAGVLVAGIVLRRALTRAGGAVLRTLPVAKDLTLAQESARFFSVMAAMSTGGVPLAEALGVANQTIHHPKLRSQLESLRTGLIEGGVLKVLIERVAALPLATRRLLIAADRAGDLDSAFESLAEDHTDIVDRQSNRLLAVLEPALIVLIFLLIGSMILALVVPMLTLSKTAFQGLSG
ncbi:MAG: type II secretion system F family protein [Planctomycetota bacterium]